MQGRSVVVNRRGSPGRSRGPVKFMDDERLHALHHGYIGGLLWVAGAAVIVGAAAVLIGYGPGRGRHAQEVKDAIETTVLLACAIRAGAPAANSWAQFHSFHAPLHSIPHLRVLLSI